MISLFHLDLLMYREFAELGHFIFMKQTVFYLKYQMCYLLLLLGLFLLHGLEVSSCSVCLCVPLLGQGALVSLL